MTLNIMFVIVIGIVLIAGGVILFVKYQMSKVHTLSFEEALGYTTANNKDAIISVGVMKDQKASFKVYGGDGKVLPSEVHTYEIGSVTKTFTAVLVSKAIKEKKINLDDTIDTYLALPQDKKYPTIRQLLTHTSGYKAHYFEKPMISNFFARRNDFYGITKEMLLDRVAAIDLSSKKKSFRYSNFGFAVLGLVLEAVYQEEYTNLINQYLQEELQLKNTKISDGTGDLKKYWDWKKGDAYIPAGAITSDIEDMLTYAKLQLDEFDYFKQSHKSLEKISASTKNYRAMGINMDKVGMAWIVDNENNIIWHNGGTGDYNSYIGFNLESQTAVVVLSNLSPGYRTPATVLGVKLLQSLKS